MQMLAGGPEIIFLTWLIVLRAVAATIRPVAHGVAAGSDASGAMFCDFAGGVLVLR